MTSIGDTASVVQPTKSAILSEDVPSNYEPAVGDVIELTNPEAFKGTKKALVFMEKGTLKYCRKGHMWGTIDKHYVTTIRKIGTYPERFSTCMNIKKRAAEILDRFDGPVLGDIYTFTCCGNKIKGIVFKTADNVGDYKLACTDHDWHFSSLLDASKIGHTIVLAGVTDYTKAVKIAMKYFAQETT